MNSIETGKHFHILLIIRLLSTIYLKKTNYVRNVEQNTKSCAHFSCVTCIDYKLINRASVTGMSYVQLDNKKNNFP